MNYGGSWIRSDVNFDNIMQAMITLFKVALTEGWIEISFKAVDS